MSQGDGDHWDSMFERSRSPGAPESSAPVENDFALSFGEDLRAVLDVSTWRVGSDLAAEYERVESEIHDAVRKEDALQKRIRSLVFPKLSENKKGPKNAGVYPASVEDLEETHRGLLFPGRVEACDGSLRVHATLPLTIYQIGISLVSYQGNQGTWCQRLFRRDLQQTSDDPVEETLRLLEGRAAEERDGEGELLQKTLLNYAERAILLRRSEAPWLMGHGDPVTYELLTGAANLELMEAGINVVRELIERHQKFVFVGSEPRAHHLLTIGHALPPYHFAIVTSVADRIKTWLRQLRFKEGYPRKLRWDTEMIPASEWIPRFIETVAPKVVVGVFRASELAPAQMFYAHEDHADLAANIAIADSMLQEHRGSPLLLDMARHVGQAVFRDSLETLAESAYAAAGAPWRYRPAP